MADIVLQRNIGELIDVKPLFGEYNWTAGGASDSATFTGASVDREGFATGSLPSSMDVDVWYSATLGSGQTLAIYMDLQHSADGSTWVDYATTTATNIVATGPSGGGVVSNVARMAVPSSNVPAGAMGVDLKGANRYVRLLAVPHLSRAGTDTAQMLALGVFAGFDFLASPTT